MVAFSRGRGASIDRASAHHRILPSNDIVTAAMDHDIRAVKRCAKRGDPIDTRGFMNETVLMLSVAQEDWKMMKLALRLGADMHARTDDGREVIDFAKPHSRSYVERVFLEEHLRRLSPKSRSLLRMISETLFLRE